jgi:hypothetical protein
VSSEPRFYRTVILDVTDEEELWAALTRHNVYGRELESGSRSTWAAWRFVGPWSNLEAFLKDQYDVLPEEMGDYIEPNLV